MGSKTTGAQTPNQGGAWQNPQQHSFGPGMDYVADTFKPTNPGGGNMFSNGTMGPLKTHSNGGQQAMMNAQQGAANSQAALQAPQPQNMFQQGGGVDAYALKNQMGAPMMTPQVQQLSDQIYGTSGGFNNPQRSYGAPQLSPLEMMQQLNARRFRG